MDWRGGGQKISTTMIGASNFDFEADRTIGAATDATIATIILIRVLRCAASFWAVVGINLMEHIHYFEDYREQKFKRVIGHISRFEIINAFLKLHHP